MIHRVKRTTDKTRLGSRTTGRPATSGGARPAIHVTPRRRFRTHKARDHHPVVAGLLRFGTEQEPAPGKVMDEMRKRVAVVGATGIAGQQFVDALARSSRGSRSACSRRPNVPPASPTARRCATPRRARCAGGAPRRRRQPCSDLRVERRRRTSTSPAVDLVFSAVGATSARELEPRWATMRPVVSTASAFRYEDDVPLLIPGVNLQHAPLLRRAAPAPRLARLRRSDPELHHHRARRGAQAAARALRRREGRR